MLRTPSFKVEDRAEKISLGLSEMESREYRVLSIIFSLVEKLPVTEPRMQGWFTSLSFWERFRLLVRNYLKVGSVISCRSGLFPF